MTTWKRLAVVAGVCGLQMLYFPIGRSLRGGLALLTPLDAYLPVWPVWVVPYDAVWLFLGLSAAWAVVRLEAERFWALSVAQYTVMIVGMTIWLVFPTYVDRPALAGNDPFTQLLRLTYAHDVRYNAFPSAHVYLTALVVFFWGRWYPRWRWLWYGLLGVVILATLFTHQHYVLDPAGGLALAWLSYRWGLWMAGRLPLAGASRRLPVSGPARRRL